MKNHIINKFMSSIQGIRAKKNQHHTINEKPNMYINLFNKNNQYFDL